MSTQGPLGPASCIDDSTIGSQAWLNPGNVTAEDATFATVAMTPINSPSHYLRATNFGFSIPAGATINGIVVEWKRQAQTGTTTIQDNAVRIIKSGTIGSTDKSSLSNWPNANAYATYGSSSDLWGLTWTDTDINGNSFGAALSAKCIANDTAEVDYVRITVYYTASSGFIAHQRRHNAPQLHAPPAVVILHSHRKRQIIAPASVDATAVKFIQHRRNAPHLHAPAPQVLTPHSHPHRRGSTSQPAPITPKVIQRRTARRAPPQPPQRGKVRRPLPHPSVGLPMGKGPERRRRRGVPLWFPHPARGRKRRSRMPGAGNGPLAARHRLTRLVRTPPPASGHKRRGRVPGIGAQPTLARRHTRKLPHARPAMPAARKRRLFVAGEVTAGRPLLHRLARLQKTGPPPLRGQRRRGRLYNTGVGLPPPPRRRTLHRLHTLPLPAGRKRRGKTFATAQPMLARRRSLHRPHPLPFSVLVLRRQRRRQGGYTVVALPRRRKIRDVGQRALATQQPRSRRGKTYKTGAFNQAVVVRQRKRLMQWPWARALTLRLPRQRPRRVVRSQIVGPPFYIVTGQIFAAGGLVGDVEPAQ